MKAKSKKIKLIKGIALVIGIIIFQAWDMSYNNIKTTIPGSFIADSLLTTSSPTSQQVAVISSDNPLLSNPLPVTSSALTFNQIKSMVKQAIDMVGGISTFVQAGDTILIKPNIVGAKPTGDGENTDIRVVKAIISIIYDAFENECKIYIGEGSARSNETMGGSGWIIAGYSDLSSDPDLAGIDFDLVDLNDEVAGGVNLVNVSSKANLAYAQGGKYWIHKYLVSPNIKFINVPVLKMHEPGITCALKNQIGIAAGAKYGWNKMKGGTGGKLVHHTDYNATKNYKTWQDEEIVDLNSCVNNFTLNVVDALLCLETQKTLMTGGSNQVRLNTIIVGADPVAVDHVCTRIIGSNPEDIAHLTLAEKIGLGTNTLSKIHIYGENIFTKFSYRFDRGSMHCKYGQGNRVWLVSPAFTFTNMTTDYIGGESTINPSKGDAPWSTPIYFFDDRIDLNSFLNPSENVVAYCYTNVYSPTAKSNVELWLNSEEDMVVYVNGENVYTYNGSRPNSNLVTDKPLINLLEGENRILVKVSQRTGCYDFTLNICEPGTLGNRVEGLKFYIRNYNEPAGLITENTATENLVKLNIKIIQTLNELRVLNVDVSDITIYNLKGLKLLSATDNKIMINNLNNGAYIVVVKLTNGSAISRKFLKS